MKFFVDTADIKQIEELIPTGFVDGVTTNPSLIAKNGDDMAKTIKTICSIVSGPVSAEVTATDFDTMLQEGEYLASLAKNVTVKVPLTPHGLRTCKMLRERNIMVNVTLCFTAAQALLAAKAGASFISPFVGRLDDQGENGMDLIEDIVDMYDNYDFKTEVIVASVRSTQHVIDSAVIGAHISTLPPKLIHELYN
ncbi:fructose-6-phosphate aldolase, partial [Pelagibacteraceae bacterium]|nr:fructose-6-phosphate aldolase [Pelagibacteraceae bacterium]